MKLQTLKSFLAIASVTLGSFLVPACFVDNPDEAQPRTDSGIVVEVPEDADAASSAEDAGPPLCAKYGGYSTVELIITKLFDSLVADCRISPFFTGLDAERQGHLYDCLVKQVAVVLGCPGIEYDVDNQGVECRDMRTAHKGLAIRGEDFDALVGDLVAVLQGLGVTEEDIGAVAPTVLGLRDDIVTNSAPGLARPICEADGGP